MLLNCSAQNVFIWKPSLSIFDLCSLAAWATESETKIPVITFLPFNLSLSSKTPRSFSSCWKLQQPPATSSAPGTTNPFWGQTCPTRVNKCWPSSTSKQKYQQSTLIAAIVLKHSIFYLVPARANALIYYVQVKLASFTILTRLLSCKRRVCSTTRLSMPENVDYFSPKSFTCSILGSLSIRKKPQSFSSTSRSSSSLKM